MQEEDPFDWILQKIQQKKILMQNLPNVTSQKSNKPQPPKLNHQKLTSPKANTNKHQKAYEPQTKNNQNRHKNQKDSQKPEKKIYIPKNQYISPQIKIQQAPKKRYLPKDSLKNNYLFDQSTSKQSGASNNELEVQNFDPQQRQNLSNYERSNHIKKETQIRGKQLEQRRKNDDGSSEEKPYNRRDRKQITHERPQRTQNKRQQKRVKDIYDLDEDDERQIKSEKPRNYERTQEMRQARKQQMKDRNFNQKNSQQNKNYQNNRNNRGERREQKQLFYKNECQKYLDNFERLQQNEEQLGIQIKNLKKYLLSSQLFKSFDERPKQISVLKCLDCPVIFFEYLYKGQKRYMQLKDLKKGTGPKLYQFYSIIKKIYDMHYYAVDIDFEQTILQIAKVKAKQRSIYLALNKRDNRRQQGENKTTLMYYYCINQKSNIELTFFDFAVKQVNFGEKYVQNIREKITKQHYQNYERFLKSAKNDDLMDVANIGEQQVDSDHEITNSRTNYHLDFNKQIKKVQKRIEEILNFDITELQEQMDQKNQQQLQLITAESNDSEKIERLGQQVQKLSRDIDNFKNVKYDVERQLTTLKFKKDKSISHYESLNLALKRLIFAKKQLDSDLPILGKKQQIFQLLDKNNLIILQGQTGSGKSTQLPQILCEYYKLFQDPKVLPVLVTQPRKIATRSLAERVAEELEQKGGNFVDYVAASGKKHHPKAKIVFKLDRLVLDQLVESPTLDDYSCLVIDEAHQRTISIDVILGLVKDLLSKRKDFKVIITSASMEISLFQKYFNKKTLKVSGRMYPVNIKYLPSQEDDMVKKIQKAIDQQLLTSRNVLHDKYKGHILVFCADTSQIQKLTQIFQKKLNRNVFMVIPLHGKLSPQEQKRAFAKTKQHKLIFASRIAETAITIDGIKVVIDPGWDREMQYDQRTKFSSMKLTQISQSSAKQRAGRAGRTQEGYCLRLYSQYQFKTRRFNKLPEIKNIALETLILRLKILGIENVSSFDYIERPDEQGMKTSTEILKMIGCLDQSGKITTIGSFLVKIPIQPFLARAIIEGLLMEKTLSMDQFDKLDRKHSKLTQPVIQILCMILSAGNLFRITENFKQLGDYAKYKHFSHEKGDFFFLKNIYDQFKIILNHDRRQLNQWLQKSFLIKKSLLQVKDLVKEIKSIIKQFNIDPKQMKYDILKCKSKLEKYTNEEDRILSCLTTCFAANLCLYSGHPQIGYTYMNLQKIVTIYGTSCLSLLGICPKWVLAYDFYENKDGKLFCKVANEIDYQFLKNTVEDYVLEKYRIQSLKDFNPFYKQVTYQLESLILLQLKEFYDTRERRIEKQVQFLKNLNLSFNEANNSVNIFIKCDQKDQNEKQKHQKQLQGFIQSLRKRAQSKFVHNYVGNIYVSIGNGFQIEKIQFKTAQKIYQLSNLDEETFSDIKNQWSEAALIQSFGNNKIKIYIENDQILQILETYLEFLTQKQNKKITIRKQFSDKRKKVPQTKIYLHWYAGKSQRSNILLQFFSNFIRNQKERLTQSEIIDLTARQERYLNQALQKLKQKEKRRNIFGMLQARLPQDIRKLCANAREINGVRTTKSGNGINIYTDSLDQIDLLRFFNKLIITNNINFDFELPKFIKKFREPERPQCEWKDSKWTEEIKKLLESAGEKKQSFIRVWGYGIKPKPKEKITQLERSYRVDMKAEIKTFETNLLESLKQKYDGRTGILGYEKLHVTSMFTQSVVGISERAFNNLKDQYDYNVDKFIRQYPGLVIDHFVKSVRKNDKKAKVFVHVSSENREHILEPVRVLNNLFTPKYITLTDVQFRFLNNDQGNRMLEQIEIEYDYKIYFGFDKHQRKIKLYCHQSLENQIQLTLRQRLSQIRYHDESISYKGKNLKKIEKIVKDKIKQIEDWNFDPKNKNNTKFLSYQIVFSYRKIKITADVLTFTEVKREIMDVKVEEKDKNCQICFQEMLSPYKLFNCKHSFCWACLSSSIKQFKSAQKMQLRCTYTQQNQDNQDIMCNCLINIYDISKILSQQELYQIFDIHISKYVENHPNEYKRCPTPDCQKIFEVEQINEENQIDCQLCGKHLCLKCQVSHKNYTCQEWKDMLNLADQHLEKMGIKKCPKCKNGIQKNGGCHHITCAVCKSHVCWLCTKLFPTSNQCYDHLAKDHGGIFPNNPY